jgi:putative transposase
MKGRLRPSKTKLDKDSTMSNPTSMVQLILPLFATVESPVPSKETILIDKSPLCNPSILKQKSSETLEALSTSKGKDCKPYWTDFCGGISSRLLLPTETDLQGLDSTLYDTWSNKTVDKSWFKTQLYTVQKPNLLPIFSASSTSSLVECTDLESTVKKSRKIRIFLTAAQKQLIKQWFGVSRLVYNTTIKLLQDGVIKANWKVIKTGILNSLPDFCKDVPYQIKSMAIKDACKSVSNAKKKLIDGGGISKCRFRSRKDPVQSSYIPKSAVSQKGIYHTILGEAIFSEVLPAIFGDCRLVLAYGDYYLTMPEDAPRLLTDNQGRVVALDPGIRTFQTFLSENRFGEIGTAANIVIQKLCFKLDALISKITKAKCKQKKRLKLAANRLRGKIKNLVSELQKKTARFLVNNFDIILLPAFETSQMSKKAKRRIRSKSVRQMLTLSHYKFKQFLKHKAFENCKLVIDVNEAYTSKTVSWTGEIVHNLGGAKVIKSKLTGLSMSRDLNGARGIFLRAVVDTPLKECIC